MNKKILILLILFGIGFLQAEEIDIIDNIKKHLPQGWFVKFGKSAITIETSALETRSSDFRNGPPGVSKGKVHICFVLLPRYSSKLLKKIKNYNDPIEKKLKEMNYYSNEYRNLSAKLICVPYFYDDRYGYYVYCSSQVPNKQKDKENILNVLRKISVHWKSYKKDMTVIDKLDSLIN